MALAVTLDNMMLDAISATGGVTFLSLHTADPSTTGANEVPTGTYARVAVTWASAASGSKAIAAPVDFAVPASTTVTHVGMWSAATSGTFFGGAALSASEAFASAGTYTLDSLTVTLG